MVDGINNAEQSGIDKAYKCQVCSKESKSALEAVTHLLEHSTAVLQAANLLIKDPQFVKALTVQSSGTTIPPTPAPAVVAPAQALGNTPTNLPPSPGIATPVEQQDPTAPAKNLF
ncbi:MAG: hypothetical protein ACYCO0_00160 [Candidatus Micrarchaeaceae archaeon]